MVFAQCNVCGPEPPLEDNIVEAVFSGAATTAVAAEGGATAGAGAAADEADEAGGVLDALDALDDGMGDMGMSDSDEGEGEDGSSAVGARASARERGPWCRAAQRAMARGGEQPAFACGAAQYLLLAEALLRVAAGPLPAPKPEDGAGDSAAAEGTSNDACFREDRLDTAHWWLARALLMHQRALTGAARELRDECRARFGAARALLGGGDQGAGEGDGQIWLPRAARAAIELEDALADAYYSRPAAAARKLEAAEQLLGVRVGVVGAMGYRTRHQQDPKAQLVARVARVGARAAEDEAAAAAEAAERAAMAGEAGAPGADAALGEAAAAARGEVERAEEQGVIDDAANCDILERPRLVEVEGQTEVRAPARARRRWLRRGYDDTLRKRIKPRTQSSASRVARVSNRATCVDPLSR